MEIWISVWVVSIVITCWIAQKKGQGILGIFLGCFFGPIAILFALASSSRKSERKNERIEKSVGSITVEKISQDESIGGSDSADSYQHNMNSNGMFDNKPIDFIQYSIISIAWFSITLLIAKNFATNHFWIVVVSVYLFSIPIVLCGIYINTISQIRRLNLFAKRGGCGSFANHVMPLLMGSYMHLGGTIWSFCAG